MCDSDDVVLSEVGGYESVRRALGGRRLLHEIFLVPHLGGGINRMGALFRVRDETVWLLDASPAVAKTFRTGGAPPVLLCPAALLECIRVNRLYCETIRELI